MDMFKYARILFVNLFVITQQNISGNISTCNKSSNEYNSK